MFWKMKDRIAISSCFLVLMMAGLFQLTRATGQYFISAPDIFHLNQKETVSIVIMTTPDNRPVEVSLHLEGESRRTRFSEKSVRVSPGTPQSVEMRVTSEDLEDSPINVQYIHLVAECVMPQLPFKQSSKVMVSKRSHVVFLQLDKPIYTPRQNVQFRVYTLDLDLKPVQIPLLVDVINPQGVVMATYDPSDSNFFSGNYTDSGILSATYQFNDLPVLGNWKVKVKYGHKMQQVSEARFEVEEYSLPTFAVTIECPNVVLPKNEYSGIDIHISAKYLYGESPPSPQLEQVGHQPVEFEAVSGTAHVRTGLLDEQGSIIYFFNTTVPLSKTRSRPTGLQSSRAPKTTIKVPLEHLFDDTMGYSFSDVVGQRLLIEATVTDQDTDIRSTEIQTKTIFSRHEFVIDLSQTPKYFSPGLFTLRIKTTYPNGAIKKNAMLAISGEALSGDDNSWSGLNREQRNNHMANPNQISTDDNGRAQYTFKIPQNTKKINIDIAGKSSKMRVSSFGSSRRKERSSKKFSATSYQSVTKSFVHIQISQTNAVQPSQLLHANVHLTIGGNLSLPSKYYYMVLGRGNILDHDKRDISQTNSRLSVSPLYITVTDDMSPGARLLVYFVQNKTNGESEIIADVLWFEVERHCTHQDDYGDSVNVALYTSKRQYRPSENIWLRYQANPNSIIALLAVDEAVYLLNDQNSMTSHKLLEMLASLDIGCSPGGGSDNQHVFQGAGLTAITNLGMNTPMRQSEKCAETFIRKRRALNEPAALTEVTLEECCTQGIIQASEQRKKSACISQSVHQLGRTAACKNQMLRCCLGHLKSPVDYPMPSTSTTTTTLDSRFPNVRPGDDYDDDYEDLARGGASVGFFPTGDEWEDTTTEVEFADFNGIPARRRFPESFLFQTADTGSTGEHQLQVSLPDSITTWVFQAVAVHKDNGICVAQPHNVTTFKKLFIKVNMPATAIKGEQILVKAIFYNYHDDTLGVQARAYLFVDEGICAKARPHEQSERVSLGKIPKRGTTSHSWPIIALKTGSFNITVVLTTPKGADKVEKWLVVKPLGEIRNISVPITLDPSGRSDGYLGDTATDAGSLRTYIDNKIDSSPPKQKVTVNMKALRDIIPEHAVQGTTVCSVRVEGSVLAPIVDQLISEDGLDTLWGIPSPRACGEQTISKVAPTIMAALYLKHTNRLTKPLEKTAKSHIKTSLERELRYKQSDGSFSFWPNDDSSSRDRGKSTWLTAFVVKLMGLAATKFDVLLKFEGKSVSTEEVICEAVDWLLTQQQNDGHFREPYVDRFQSFRLVGGVQNTRSLTAFVLIALSQAEDTVEEHCSKDISTELERGVGYLEDNVDTLGENSTDPFTVAIVTYALVLSNSQRVYDVNTILQRRMVFDQVRNVRYLPEYDLEDYQGFVSEWPFWRQFYWSYVKSSVTVEQTAYALLAQVHLQDYNTASPMVAWLLSQRNSFGAFRSTQDTVMALEALTVYKVSTEEMRTNLQCDLKLQGQANPIESYTLNSDMYKLSHERVLSDTEINQGNLIIETSGEGSAQAFLNIQYYSLSLASQLASVCPHFSLNVTDTEDNFKMHTVEVCARNIQKQDTSMGVIDIGIVTDQKVLKETMKNIQNQIKAGEQLRTFETSKTSVTLYFEMIPKDDNLCISIHTQASGDVENIQPVAVTVYDYYEPSKKCSKFYGGDPPVYQKNRGILRHSCNANGQCQCNEY